MAASRKSITLGVVLVLVLAVVAGVWFRRSPLPPTDDGAQADRDNRSAVRLIELKDSALAALENRDFKAAEPLLLDLATVGIGEPVGARNWLINRIAVISTIDEEKDPQAYADTVERARTALNLDWNIERTDPVRYQLASRIEFLSQKYRQQIDQLHIGAGRAPDDPLFWYDLYAAERDSQDESVRADGENALRMLHDLVPDNLYVLLEWMGVQARRNDAAIVRTLEVSHQRLIPFLSTSPGQASVNPLRVLDTASAAAKKNDWKEVQRNVTALIQFGSAQRSVQSDKRRVDRGLVWRIKTDYSEKFYGKHVLDRVLPKASAPLHFRESSLEGPLATLSDVLDARCVDFDLDGRLDLAVLRKASFEVYGRDAAGKSWAKIAEIAVPAGSFTHVVAANFDREAVAAKSDFVLFGPAGLLVVENRLPVGTKTRSLVAIDAPQLAAKTKGAVSVAVVDFDGDGGLDLVVARQVSPTATDQGAEAISVWQNRGQLQFDDVTPRSGLGKNITHARGLVAADWNHDFDIDVLFVGGSAPAGAGLLKGGGLGRFRVQPLAADNPLFHNATALAVFDADANGSCDLLVASPSGMALMQTATTQPGDLRVLGIDTISDFPAEELLVADFDNDGSQDVIGWNRDSIRCFHGLGNGRFEPAADALPENPKAVLAADHGDIDGDGDIDLLVVAPEGNGGRLHFLQNDGGNSNNWIDVSLVGGQANGAQGGGDRANSAGIGSTLQIKIGPVCQTQVVTGPVTHFGIGKLDAAQVLRAVWPNGVPTNTLEPAKNRLIRVGLPQNGWR